MAKKKKSAELLLNPEQAAEAADLRYVSDDEPGITRKKHGKGFTYFDPKGNKISDQRLHKKLNALAIPPAWTEVWICADLKGHILATGRDDKGRKQYRYHPRWEALRNQAKFDNMKTFGKHLPKIREEIDHDLRKKALSREKVTAAVIRLMEKTLIRIGNPEYVRSNESYGLTTLQDDHVEVYGKKLEFNFMGKSGIEHTIDLDDQRLAKIVKECQEIPGYNLFQYYDENSDPHSITSVDVNQYLKDLTGEHLTAKDFRTWGGTVRAIRILREFPLPGDEKEGKKLVREAIKCVAKELGNTVAVCRSYYVHPAVLDAYLTGRLAEVLAAQEEEDSHYALTASEKALMALI